MVYTSSYIELGTVSPPPLPTPVEKKLDIYYRRFNILFIEVTVTER